MVAEDGHLIAWPERERGPRFIREDARFMKRKTHARGALDGCYGDWLLEQDMR